MRHIWRGLVPNRPAARTSADVNAIATQIQALAVSVVSRILDTLVLVTSTYFALPYGADRIYRHPAKFRRLGVAIARRSGGRASFRQ